MTHVWMMVMRVRIRVPTWWRRTAMRTWMHHVWWGRHPTGGRWDRPSVMPGRWTLRRSWWGALRRSFPSRTNASSLPGLIGNSHRKICSLLILDLAAFVDQCLRTCIVQALNTFTLVTADHTSLETLQQKWGQKVRGKGSLPLTIHQTCRRLTSQYFFRHSDFLHLQPMLCIFCVFSPCASFTMNRDWNALEFLARVSLIAFSRIAPASGVFPQSEQLHP